MNINEVKATIAAGSEAVDEARTEMIETGDQITDARGQAAVTHDSRHPQVEAGHVRLRRADAYRETLG